MGFMDWLKGVSDQIQTVTAANKSNYDLQSIPLPGECQFLAVGTSHRQDNLRRLGLGDHQFVLNPERGNKYDNLAVMVQGVKNGSSVHVGYLPKGSVSQEVIHKLGTLMMKKNEVIIVDGEIMNGKSGLIVQLHMPENSTVRRMISQYDGTLAKIQERIDHPEPLSSAQQDALNDLKSRKIKFTNAELHCRAFSAAGSYVEKPLAADKPNLEKFIGGISEFETWKGVAYLIPESDGQVGLHIDGMCIDHLTKDSAKLLAGKLTEPAPVKCTVDRIVSARGDRGHIKLTTGTTPF